MNKEFENYKKDNLTKILSKIALLPPTEQLTLLQDLDFTESKVLANVLATNNSQLLDLVFSTRLAKEHWFNQENSGFFIEMALAQPDGQSMLEILLKNSYPTISSDKHIQHSGIINLIRSLSDFLQEVPEKTREIMPIIESHFKREPYLSLIKEYTNSALTQTIIKRNTEPLFKFLVALCNDAIEYQDKHLIPLIKQNPIDWLKNLGVDRFLHIKEIHPIKENYYSILKTIKDTVSMDDPEVKKLFTGVLSSALSFGSNKPIYLKTLTDLEIIIPIFDLHHRYLEKKNFCINLFDNYIYPLWDKTPIFVHLDTIAHFFTRLNTEGILQNKYAEEVYKRCNDPNLDQDAILELVKKNNREQLESLLLKTHVQLNIKNSVAQKLL